MAQRKPHNQPGVNWTRIIEYTIMGILAGIGYIITKTIIITIKAIVKG